MYTLKDKIAVITGGAQGIGFATAEKLISKGCEVMIWDIDDELGNQSSKKLL